MKPSLALAALFPFLLFSPFAHADLTINFQFDSAGTTTKYLTPADANTDIPVQVWAAITGSGTLGITSAVFRAQSQQIDSGAFIIGGVTSAGFAPLPTFNNLATHGTAADVTDPLDGITDLGKLSGPASVGLLDPKARATIAPAGQGGVAYYTVQGGWAIIPGGQSIELGTFSVHVGTLTSGGTTTFNVALPQDALSAIWFENAQTLDPKGEPTYKNGVKGPNSHGGIYSPGTSISFTTSDNPPTITTPVAPPISPLNPIAPTPRLTFILIDLDLGTSGLTIPQLKVRLNNLTSSAKPTAIVGDGDVDPLNEFDAALGEDSYNQHFNADRSHVLLFEYTSIPDALTNSHDVNVYLASAGVSSFDHRLLIFDPISGTLVPINAPEPTTAALLLAATLPLISRNKSRRRCR